MSWIYTIVFAGLVYSSQGEVYLEPNQGVESVPVVLERVVGDETEKFEQTYPLNANGRVNVSNVNGSIVVEAWDRNEVKLEYTKVADSKERLADVEIKIESKPDYFSVETDYGDWKTRNGDRWRNSGKLNVEFRLMVPRGAVLNEIETVNGSISVSNFTNITKVSAVNGSVIAANLRGTAKLCTVNGEVKADFDRLESGSKISLETVNGRVNLVIPSDSNATVRADSLNGNITNDFGLPVRKGKYIGRDLYGRLGTGDVQIRLDSVNGGLTISRKNDGKNLSPATNLLQQKDKDDDDWDKDDNKLSSGKVEKLDKQIDKIAKETMKASERAVADTHKALVKMKPEIATITAESLARAAEAIEQATKIVRVDELRQKIQDVNLAQLATLARIADATFFPGLPKVEKKSGSFAVKGTPKVTVVGNGCSVTVRGWDKSEVQYRVTQFSEPRNAAPLKITDDHSDSAVTIKVENPDYEARKGNFSNDRVRIKLEIFVPRKSNLKINANGEIRIDGVSGEVELTGADEPINVRDVDGKLRVSNADGRVRVIGFKGEIDANTSDGLISLEGDFKSLKANATDGSIVLTLPVGTSADLEANCPDLSGDGITITRVGGNDLRTKYRIGNGGATFQVATKGEIRIRGAGILSESF